MGFASSPSSSSFSIPRSCQKLRANSSPGARFWSEMRKSGAWNPWASPPALLHGHKSPSSPPKTSQSCVYFQQLLFQRSLAGDPRAPDWPWRVEMSSKPGVFLQEDSGILPGISCSLELSKEFQLLRGTPGSGNCGWIRWGTFGWDQGLGRFRCWSFSLFPVSLSQLFFGIFMGSSSHSIKKG